jgi:SH3-like domain-containing protein
MTAVRHVAAGLLSGLGAVVLLQQFAVLYPTGTVTYTDPEPAHSESQPIAGEAVAAWAPTHRVPAEGLEAWQEPDPAAAPIARLDAGLEVRVERTDGAWAQIVCENGWSAWVDDRRLEARA